jgi:hypothetical protein
LANIRSNLFYLDLFACSNFFLFAAGFYDRVHISPFDEFRQGLGSRSARSLDLLDLLICSITGTPWANPAGNAEPASLSRAAKPGKARHQR